MIWYLAWPAIVSFLSMAVMAISFTWIAGYIGADAVAVVSSGMRLWMLLQALQMALAMATTALVARAWGAGDKRRAGAVALKSVFAGAFLGLSTGLPVAVLHDEVAALFGLPAAVTEELSLFVLWSGLFNVVYALRFVVEAGLRATGDVRLPMAMTIIVNIAAILFGASMALGLGEWSGLGAIGLVLGSSIATTLSTGFMLIYWSLGKRPMKPTLADWRNGTDWKALWIVGWPSALEQGVLQLSLFLFVIVLAGYGTAVYAAYGIATTLMFLPVTIGIGFGSAAATLVGQRLGAKDLEGAKRAGLRAMTLAVAIMSLTGIATAYFAGDVAALMIDDAVVRDWTAKFLVIIAVLQPLIAVDFTVGGALRGAGDTRYPMTVTLISQLGGRLGLGFVLGQLGVDAMLVVSVLIVDYGLKIVLLCLRFFAGDRWQSAFARRAN